MQFGDDRDRASAGAGFAVADGDRLLAGGGVDVGEGEAAGFADAEAAPAQEGDEEALLQVAVAAEQCLVFGGAERPITPRSCLVIVETLSSFGARSLVGVLADAVAGVADLRRGDIAPAPACDAALRADALTGIGTVDGTYLLLLDIDRALADTALPESFTDGPYTTEETSC